MWNIIKEIILVLFIVACITGLLGGLVWAVTSSNNEQAEKERNLFIECCEKTHDAEWCYDL